jgi:HlyD family secretion protein
LPSWQSPSRRQWSPRPRPSPPATGRRRRSIRPSGHDPSSTAWSARRPRPNKRWPKPTPYGAQCRAAHASWQRNLAQIDLARANLSRSRLVAPFAGVVAKVEGELNEFVTPSPLGISTPPAVDLIENSCFYVTAPIDEVDAAAVRVGMAARISLDAFRERRFSGTVRRIAPYVLDLEKQARTVAIEVAFDHPEDFAVLLAGYSADVEIILASRDDTLYLPTEAVVGGDAVFVFREGENRLRRTTFTPGLSNWLTTEALAGLAEGWLVVTNVDLPGLADGVSARHSGGQR